MSEEPSYYKPALTEPCHSGCSHCADKPIVARMDMYLAVGFGVCYVLKDREEIYNDRRWDEEKEDYPTLGQYELLAQADPDHNWQARFYAPLYSATYQRQGKEHWVLIEKGQGFA